VTITLHFVHETPEAVLYRVPPDFRQVWIPKSCMLRRLKWPTGKHEVTMEDWKAEELLKGTP
jgi:hypothetical protein